MTKLTLTKTSSGSLTVLNKKSGNDVFPDSYAAVDRLPER